MNQNRHSKSRLAGAAASVRKWFEVSAEAERPDATVLIANETGAYLFSSPDNVGSGKRGSVRGVEEDL